MYCKKCGKEINENAQFCEFCGFNQNEDVEKVYNKKNSKHNNDETPISWYQLDRQYQKNLKREFKAIYPSNAGLEGLAVICYIAGFIAALFCVGSYALKIGDTTVSSGTFISVPMLILTLFLFVAGTVAGYSSNHKFDKAFSSWLIATKNIIK